MDDQTEKIKKMDLALINYWCNQVDDMGYQERMDTLEFVKSQQQEIEDYKVIVDNLGEVIELNKKTMDNFIEADRLKQQEIERLKYCGNCGNEDPDEEEWNIKCWDCVRCIEDIDEKNIDNWTAKAPEGEG